MRQLGGGGLSCNGEKGVGVYSFYICCPRPSPRMLSRHPAGVALSMAPLPYPHSTLTLHHTSTHPPTTTATTVLHCAHKNTSSRHRHTSHFTQPQAMSQHITHRLPHTTHRAPQPTRKPTQLTTPTLTNNHYHRHQSLQHHSPYARHSPPRMPLWQPIFVSTTAATAHISRPATHATPRRPHHLYFSSFQKPQHSFTYMRAIRTHWCHSLPNNNQHYHNFHSPFMHTTHATANCPHHLRFLTCRFPGMPATLATMHAHMFKRACNAPMFKRARNACV